MVLSSLDFTPRIRRSRTTSTNRGMHCNLENIHACLIKKDFQPCNSKMTNISKSFESSLLKYSKISSDPDLVDASSSALQDDHLQQFGSVTLCILTCIYSQHLQQVKGQISDSGKHFIQNINCERKMETAKVGPFCTYCR